MRLPRSRAQAVAWLLGCVAAALMGGCRPDPVTFVVMADLHLDPAVPERSRRLEAAVAMVNRLEPHFVVICGDLIDVPGNVRARAELRHRLDAVDPGIPVHLLPGNHDIGITPSRVLLADYRAAIGADWYSFRQDGVLGIALNSPIIKHGGHLEDEVERQWQWLRSTLGSAPGSGAESVFVFMHHPPFVRLPRETGGRYNLPPQIRKPYLELFKNAGVRGVFAGHRHRGGRGIDGELEVVTLRSLGKPGRRSRPEIGLVRVHAGHFEYEPHEVVVGPSAAAEVPDRDGVSRASP